MTDSFCSSSTKSQHVDEDVKALMDLVKEQGWDKEKAEMIHEPKIPQFSNPEAPFLKCFN